MSDVPFPRPPELLSDRVGSAGRPLLPPQRDLQLLRSATPLIKRVQAAAPDRQPPLDGGPRAVLSVGTEQYSYDANGARTALHIPSIGFLARQQAGEKM
jgi:hypothetical protein